jgi:hypothetical protein
LEIDEDACDLLYRRLHPKRDAHDALLLRSE